MKSMFALVLAVLLTPSMAAGASLGEAAKKEKERREKNKEAGVTAVRVITQDDVKTNDSPVDASGSYTSSGSESPGEASAPSSKSRSGDEERRWRSRAKQARERVESARRKLANTPARITRHMNQYPYQGFITEDNPDYKYAEEELKRAETALSDIEDDARKQGVLPGWLR
jgi:hypothetical protein